MVHCTMVIRGVSTTAVLLFDCELKVGCFYRCYLYRLVRSFFALSTHWRTFDPFFTQKQDTFKSSGKAIYRTLHRLRFLCTLSYNIVASPELATTMHEMATASPELKSSSDDLEVIFKEMVQMCLWYVAFSDDVTTL